MCRELLAIFIVFLAAVSYGIDATVMRYSGVTDPIILAGIRVSATAIFLMLTLWRFPRFRKGKTFFWAIVCSIASSIFYISAVKIIGVGPSLLLFYGSVVWTCIWKWFDNDPEDPVTVLDFIAAILVLTGNIVLLYQPVVLENPFGYIFGVIAGLSFSAYLFLCEKQRKKTPNDKYIFSDVFIFALGALVITSFTYSMVFNIAAPTASDCLILCADGCLYGFAYFLLFLALGMIKVHVMNMYLGALEPIAGIMCAALIIGEELSMRVVYGFTIIIFGILIKGLILRFYSKKEN